MILVTGASGFVGAALLMRLVAEGKGVRGAYRTGHDSPMVGVHSVPAGNLGERQDWSTALASVQVVVHAAARVHVMRDTTSDPLEAFRKANVAGTMDLARQAAAANVRRFVFVSSVKVNGEATVRGQCFRETDVSVPQDAYGQSKHEAELGLRQIAADTGMEVVIVRPPLVYGSGVKANFASLMRAVKKGVPLPLGAIHNQRSLIGIDNLVDFLITCIDHPSAANETFLVSDGQDVSVPELVRGLADAMNVKAHLLPIPVSVLQMGASLLGKRGAVNRLCENLQVDIDKTRELLKWNPPISLSEGLRRAVQRI